MNIQTANVTIQFNENKQKMKTSLNHQSKTMHNSIYQLCMMGQQKRIHSLIKLSFRQRRFQPFESYEWQWGWKRIKYCRLSPLWSVRLCMDLSRIDWKNTSNNLLQSRMKIAYATMPSAEWVLQNRTHHLSPLRWTRHYNDGFSDNHLVTAACLSRYACRLIQLFAAP